MAEKLYPLLFKEGILRDGSLFQGEYCTDGQWVRWQRGKLRKIGGRLAMNLQLVLAGYTNFYLVQQDETNLWAYIVNNNEISVTVFNINTGAVIIAKRPIGNTVNLVNSQNYLVQIIPIVLNRLPQLLFYVAANYGANINSTTEGQLFTIILFNQNAILVNQPIATNNDVGKPDPDIATLTSGGVLYTDGYLIMYGSAGKVLLSASEKSSANNNNTPLLFDFTNLDNDVNGGFISVPIAPDKVVYAASVRGGDTVPTILFWTLTSVVKMTNVGINKIILKPQIITNACSIISSRSVVENDGFFYWAGTDNFFIYNAQVITAVNNQNLNYFFENVDMTKRQLVHGVCRPLYKEIWWYYPEKFVDGVDEDGNPIRIPNLGGCTRAVVYNYAFEYWYDTAVKVDASMLLQSQGKVYTLGLPVAQNNPTNRYIWQEETDVDEVIYNDQNVTQSYPIISSFTTPVFSWASFSPLKGTDGVDRIVVITGIEPNMKMTDSSKTLTLKINIKNYAQSPFKTIAAIEFTGKTEQITNRYSGRNITFTISSTAFFEMGNWFIKLGVAGEHSV